MESGLRLSFRPLGRIYAFFASLIMDHFQGKSLGYYAINDYFFSSSLAVKTLSWAL
jgi:hypothetical protein